MLNMQGIPSRSALRIPAEASEHAWVKFQRWPIKKTDKNPISKDCERIKPHEESNKDYTFICSLLRVCGCAAFLLIGFC